MDDSEAWEIIKGMLPVSTECSEEVAFKTLDMKFNDGSTSSQNKCIDLSEIVEKLRTSLYCLTTGEQTRPQRLIQEVIDSLRPNKKEMSHNIIGLTGETGGLAYTHLRVVI